LAAGTWRVPLLLGVLAAGGLLLLPPLHFGQSAVAPDQARIILPFDHARLDAPPAGAGAGPGGGPLLLGVWNRSVAVRPGSWPVDMLDADGNPSAPHRSLVALGDRLAGLPIPLPPGPGPWTLQLNGTPVATLEAAPPGPRFARMGDNSTLLTFYGFTADGLLLASDAGVAEYGRFVRHGDFRHLEPALWYFGSGPVPKGATRPPSSLASITGPLHDAMEGLPEGGIATIRIESGPVVSLYGPLAVTARIDRLVQTP
jgi:hypothetical protein